MSDPEALERIETLLRALLLVQLDRREQLISGVEHAKVEALLASAGMSAREIADLLGKNHDAVRKAIQRARANEPRQ